MARTKQMAIGGLLAVALAAPMVLVGAVVTVPHTFTNGAVAVAADVNANFDAIQNALNNSTFFTTCSTTVLPDSCGTGCVEEDLTGCNLDLPAGDWLVTYNVDVEAASSTSGFRGGAFPRIEGGVAGPHGNTKLTFSGYSNANEFRARGTYATEISTTGASTSLYLYVKVQAFSGHNLGTVKMDQAFIKAQRQ